VFLQKSFSGRRNPPTSVSTAIFWASYIKIEADVALMGRARSYSPGLQTEIFLGYERVYLVGG
jgi:hypothetical protein